MKCSQCGAPTDRIVEDDLNVAVALCVFCEDGVANPAAVKTVPPLPPTSEPLPRKATMKIRKAEPGEPACACGNLLRSDNTTGICKPCRKAGVTPESQGLAASPRKAKATRKPAAPKKTNGHSSEVDLDAVLGALVQRRAQIDSAISAIEILRGQL